MHPLIEDSSSHPPCPASATSRLRFEAVPRGALPGRHSTRPPPDESHRSRLRAILKAVTVWGETGTVPRPDSWSSAHRSIHQSCTSARHLASACCNGATVDGRGKNRSSSSSRSTVPSRSGCPILERERRTPRRTINGRFSRDPVDHSVNFLYRYVQPAGARRAVHSSGPPT